MGGRAERGPGGRTDQFKFRTMRAPRSPHGTARRPHCLTHAHTSHNHQPDDASDPRARRAAELRLALSPHEMLHLPSGAVNQDFFKPKRVVIVDDKKWGPAERDALYLGLERHGVGGWRVIRDTLLPRWDETALRVKASRLLGSQSLARYPGWKGDQAAVDAECAANKAIGAATGCWKNGVLVEDDAGSVAAYLAAHGVEGPAAGKVPVPAAEEGG